MDTKMAHRQWVMELLDSNAYLETARKGAGVHSTDIWVLASAYGLMLSQSKPTISD